MATRKSTARKRATTNAQATPQGQRPADNAVQRDQEVMRPVSLDTLDIVETAICKAMGITHACQQASFYGKETNDDAIGNACIVGRLGYPHRRTKGTAGRG